MIDVWMIGPEAGVDEAAKAGGEGAVVDEEGFAGGAMEGFVFRMKGGGGDDEVDVRVVLDLTAPGVEDAGEAEAGATGLGGADVLEGGGALAQEEWVEDFGMAQAERAEFFGKGEGDHEVRNG